LSMISSNNHWGLPNSQGVVAVEFDIHGDRQCQALFGGVDCLIRQFPQGYGMKLSDPLDTMGDVDDSRPSASSALRFFVEYAYQWTRLRQRPVGRFIVGAGSTARHDDFMLKYDVHSPDTQYMMWDELMFPASVHIVLPFWHSHHQFTSDMWWFSGNASGIGLADSPYSEATPQQNVVDDFATPFNLTAAGLSLADAADHILSHVEKANDQYSRSQDCAEPPRLRCQLNLNRWDANEHGELQERYHAPNCPSWNIHAGEVNTIVSFHEPRVPIARAIQVFMHAGAYALYTPLNGNPIPHAMVPLPVSLNNKNFFRARDMLPSL